MGKEFTGYIPETTQYLNNKITLSIVCELYIARENRFAELLHEDSKIKVRILEGKGDEAPRVTFNLTVDEFEYIYNFYMNGRLALPHNLIKPLHNPMTNGDYAGSWYSSAFSLEYINGNNNPWKIQIINGYGTKMSTFDVKSTTIKTFMTDNVLHKLLVKTKEYIDYFRNVFCVENVKRGLAVVAENQKGYYNPFRERNLPDFNEAQRPKEMNNNQTDSQVNNQAAQNYETNANAVSNGSVQNNTVKGSKNAQSAQKVNSIQPDIRKVKLQVTNDCVPVQGAVVYGIVIGGFNYSLYCPEPIPALKNSLDNSIIVEANLFEWNQKLCFHSIVS